MSNPRGRGRTGPGRRGRRDQRRRDGQSRIYPLPHQTRLTFEQFQRADEGCRNPGLLFDRYTAYRLGWSLESDSRTRTNPKHEALKVVRDTQMDAALHRAYVTRWRAMLAAQGAGTFEAEPEWRFVVGLGGKGPLEVGMTFHRIYGFPFIPGSSLKGLARAWAMLQLAATLGVPSLTLDEYLQRNPPGEKPRDKTPLNKLEDLLEAQDKDWSGLLGKIESDPAIQRAEGAILKLGIQGLRTNSDIFNFRQVFGCLDHVGKVVFFDAVPLAQPTLEIDVMNPHYADYYQGNAPPADYLSPTPIYFLTVGRDSRYLFAVAGPEKIQARKWLEGGLSELGSGAKTTSGYGYWERAVEEGLYSDTITSTPEITEPEVPPGYQRGRVKIFGCGERRSYGFIYPRTGGAEIFVHRDGLAEGVTTLEENQEVIFKVVQTSRGKQAEDVRPLR